MFYKNNWFSWTYDDGDEYGVKATPTSKCKFNFKNTLTRPLKSYRDELLANAQLIRDEFVGELDLLFSGGLDSEVLLRIYQELKIPINVNIFKYENDYNILEYTHAIRICNQLNVTPRIIDFNLEKFFENDAYDIWSKIYTPSSGYLPQLKMSEYVDGIPMYADGEPYWRRTSRDMSKKHPWVFELEEANHCWSLYYTTIGRTAIVDWFEYSPEVILAHSQTPIMQQLINDQIPGKLDSVSNKGIVYKECWDEIELRKKLIGFEGPEINRDKLLPPFMLEFSKQYGRNKVSNTIEMYYEQQLFDKIGIITYNE